MAAKSSYLKKLLILTGPIILIQAVVLLRYKISSEPASFKDAMDSAIETGDVGDDQRSAIRLHIALNNYRMKNEKYPDTLDQLVPDYFESVPVDPNTAEPYVYSIDGESFILGAAASGTAPAGDGTGATAEEIYANEEDALIASLNNFEDQLFIYDPTGKKDPFRPLDFDRFNRQVKGKTPLEQFDYSQFRVSAVLLDSGEPKAIIEDGNGKGHTVQIGTKIGLYEGTVSEIKPDRIIVKEITIDFTGEENTKLVDINLPVKENDFGSLTREQSIGADLKKESPVKDPNANWEFTE